MNSVISEMLSQYPDASPYDRENALKEVMQEVVLCGLSRAGFFHEAAFYGGTALRIFYGLDRFSEDLDFSLMTANPTFALDDYCNALVEEVSAYGLHVEIEPKTKTQDSMIKSAYMKANTIEHMLMCYGEGAASGIPKSKQIKVKFEVDINPPAFATFEHKYRLLPSPYAITLYDAPSLFAGKIHAVICRAWKSRVKGRDLYDFVFYLARKTPVNLRHLRERLLQSGYIDSESSCGIDDIKEMLRNRFCSIDFEQAKKDVIPFIKDQNSLLLWSADFFIQITENLVGIE